MFVGYPKDHATNIGCLLNVTTKSITPQFHMVYKDYFSTVRNEENVPPTNWMALLEKMSEHSVNAPELDKEWFDAAVEFAEHQNPMQARSASRQLQQDIIQTQNAVRRNK